MVIGSTAQQTINVAGFNSGLTTTSSPATYIRRNNSSLTPFTIQVRETANPSNISDPVTVTPKDCTALKIG